MNVINSLLLELRRSGATSPGTMLRRMGCVLSMHSTHTVASPCRTCRLIVSPERSLSSRMYR